jgi:hypothetical protein
LGAAIKRLDGTLISSHYPDPGSPVTTYKYDGYKYDFGAATSLASTTSSNWTVDAQFGFSLLNHGDEISGNHISVNFSPHTVIGASFALASPLRDVMAARVPLFAGTMNFDTILQDGETSYATGMEATAAQILFGRVGTQVLSRGSETTWGMGVGLPIDRWRLRFDYGNNIDDDFEQGVLSLLVLKNL